MQYTYSLNTACEPIIRDMPVYDAATIVEGELLMKGTTDPDSSTDESISLVTAYSATHANSAIDAVGVSLETLTTSSSPSVASAYSTTTGPAYAKVVINPSAVYQVEHSLGTSDDVAITSTSTTTLTIATLSDDIDGCFVYFPLTAAGVKGSLRLITASASGSCTMDSALTTTGTSADTACIITPILKYVTNLTADATKVASGNCQAIYGATNLLAIQVYVDRDAGIEVLQPARQSAVDDIDNVKGGNGPKFYYDMICTDHFFSPGD